jgi:molybdopterin-guanine dinucleotide biosynthesis protein A
VEKVNGLILAGGESSRMGSNKALLDYFGKPQHEFLTELLTKHCNEVFTSCKRDVTPTSFYNPLYDKFDFKSPLNGILSALETNNRVAWLSLPVDMPFINEAAINFLLSHRDPLKTATCFFDSEGENPEPLFAIWEPKAHSLLIQYYEDGRRSARGFLQTHDIRLLKSPDPKIHININNPDDFELFKKEIIRYKG